MRLILVRHAKAVPGGAGPDIERPLAERGRADAARIGEWLRAEGYAPDLALVSPAARTMQTWEGLGLDAPMEARSEIYEASAAALLRLASEAAGGTLMIVGHNPGISEAAEALAGGTEGFPTGAVAVIDVEGEPAPGAGRLAAFVTPADLEG